MPHMTIPSADKPAPRDLYQYSPEKLMEAILSPEATREFMRSPEKLETETSHDARGRRRTKVWATVIGRNGKPKRILWKPTLDRSEQQLLQQIVKHGFYAVCEDVGLAKIAKEMCCSIRTVQRVLSSLLDRFTGLGVASRDGFTNAYYFTREFLDRVGAAWLRKKRAFGAVASTARKIGAAVSTFLAKPSDVTNPDFSQFTKELNSICRKMGIPAPSTP